MKKTLLFFLLTLASVLLFSPDVLAASLSLSPASGTYSIGQQFQTRIVLDTQGQESAGADIQLAFNPAVVEAVSIQRGTIFASYLGQNINNTTGSLTLSGLIEIGTATGYNGSGTFATVTWRGKTNGTAPITFNYTVGNRNDSNVAGFNSADDILTTVTNGTYTIGSGATAAPTPTPMPTIIPTPTTTGTTPAVGSGATPTPTVNTLPQTGSAARTIIYLSFAVLCLAFSVVLFLKS